ncbi:efflux RND transporter permease subunit [Victivallaceae bacterium BBE-744-WT-12]|uniref:Efflux RND transporter permease subunit n=1 Tax=Victivallis lenta TaxID=2606640 RepID=A0A844G0Y2_9BACT|nr:efflux RND transporter permease subunit [Victivallis lenta]AVM46005.1 hydrophobe/amphiphile efflux-1 family RND transporter [Victivallales bacterium CCUG 44730]MST96565.1 efflux RND transporter permease subunit [Victivallis lenta]HBP07439.1 hydrophobe/amphiphile efflux-1 family RND transporter [Lentisphaeria bacterium]HCH87413.1 hydrophobe/amphiphile efflux-1 family RND transporter [Lentisphaeria bacterium]
MFSALFIKRPKFAIVISLFFVLAGSVCMFRLPIAEYPEVSPPTIVVMATYPGASAQVIADTVAAPLEAEVNGIEDLVYYSSTSDNSGNYSLTLTFKSEADDDMAYVNVNNAVKRAEHSLPTEVVNNGLTVYKRSSDILGMVAVTSTNPEHTPLFISNYVAIHMRDPISRIDGVGQAIVFTDMTYSMRIWLNPNKMRALGITNADISEAVSSQNVQAATGSVGTEFASDYMQFKIDTKGRLQEPAEFENIIIKTGDDGRIVRLKDVARVELGSENYTGIAHFDDRPTVPLAIFKLSDANALEVLSAVKAELENLEKNFPEGMEWTLGYDSTNFVRVTMEEIVMTLVMTFILVVAITWLFLQDWRATIVPSVTIPVSLIGTFIFLDLLGMSINTLSMFALILVIGSVVDDAICVTESCVRMIQEEHLSPFDAAMKTMQQLTGALIATTLVVVAVYAPIAFYGGMVGKIYMQFAVTMCIALILSTVNALTLSPALCALVLRPQKEPRGLYRWFNIGLNWTRNGYLGFAKLMVRRMALTLVLFAAILSANYFVYRELPGAFLPDEDKGALFCEVVLPPGASLPRTEAALSEVAEIARQLPGVDHVLSVPGRSMTAGQGENLGMAIVTLKDWSERKEPALQIKAIQSELTKRCAVLPDAQVTAFAPPAIPGLGATGGVSFAFQATGDQNSQELSQATQNLLGKIMQSGKAIYAFTSFDANTPMLHLDIDRDKAEAMKVPISAIFSTLQSQLGSIYINDFNKYGKTYKVKMQSSEDFRRNLNIVSQLYVPSSTGALVPLDALATVRWTLGPRQTERFNMFPSASVNTQGVPFFSSGQMMNLVQNIVDTEFSHDYQLSWTDMSYQESQNEGMILYLMVLALTFAYLFLVAQYESWTMPISVILSVGTATLGGLLALWIFQMSFNIYCQLGLLMLIGLTAKTAILMVEYSKQERDAGQSVSDAALNGMRLRFRSVMMTALSFVIGVFPMVFASGAGAGSRQAIGITTFWGMLVATIVGMMFIPGLYAAFQRIAEATVRFFGKKA